MIRRFAAIALAFALAACGAVTDPLGVEDPFGIPQPFRGTGDQRIIGSIAGERAVYVAPVQGEAGPAAVLRAALVDALQGQDVVATAETPLAGALTLSAALSGGTARIALSDGERAIDSFEAAGTAPEIAAAASVRVAAAVGRGTVAPVPVAGGPAAPARRAVVAIAIVKGEETPAAALGRAMAAELRGLGVAVDQRAAGAYGVGLALAMGPESGGLRRVTIRWTVTGPGGRELGVVDQDNELPAAEVARAWAAQAAMAARAAAPQIAQLVARDLGAR